MSKTGIGAVKAHERRGGSSSDAPKTRGRPGAAERRMPVCIRDFGCGAAAKRPLDGSESSLSEAGNEKAFIWENTAGGSIGTLTGVIGNGGESCTRAENVADVGEACGDRRRTKDEMGVARS
jgi:hypothetical protein